MVAGRTEAVPMENPYGWTMVREEQQEMMPERPRGQSKEARPSLVGHKRAMRHRGPDQSWALELYHQRAAQGKSGQGSKFTPSPQRSTMHPGW